MNLSLRKKISEGVKKAYFTKSFGFQKGNKINLGRHLSQETKIKIGLTHKGKKESEKTKQKLSKIRKGKPSFKKGRKYPQFSGKNHWNWKGGLEKRICIICNKEFDIPLSVLKQNKGKLCSMECKSKHRSLFLRRENSSGWKGGVTKNLVCKYCKKIFDSDKRTTKFCSKRCFKNWIKDKNDFLIAIGKRRKNIKIYPSQHRTDINLYKEWRKSILRKNKYTCQNCKQIGGKLIAHHIHPYNNYPELQYNLDNGITLCKECHKKTDNFGWKGYWKDIINREVDEANIVCNV